MRRYQGYQPSHPSMPRKIDKYKSILIRQKVEHHGMPLDTNGDPLPDYTSCVRKKKEGHF